MLFDEEDWDIEDNGSLYEEAFYSDLPEELEFILTTEPDYEGFCVDVYNTQYTINFGEEGAKTEHTGCLVITKDRAISLSMYRMLKIGFGVSEKFQYRTVKPAVANVWIKWDMDLRQDIHDGVLKDNGDIV
tara:strand:+ start:6803 stop:7195 length:393 start_codon:yes stop_codon:yes gene_type:complete